AALPFVRQFLAAADQVAEEAALALGGSRQSDAGDLLLETWPTARGLEYRQALKTAPRMPPTPAPRWSCSRRRRLRRWEQLGSDVGTYLRRPSCDHHLTWTGHIGVYPVTREDAPFFSDSSRLSVLMCRLIPKGLQDQRFAR